MKGPFTDHTKVEKLLREAQGSGLVTEWDDGRGDFVWFNIRPGKEARALRDRIKALQAPAATLPETR